MLRNITYGLMSETTSGELCTRRTVISDFQPQKKGSLITKYADEAHLEHYLRYYSIL